MREHRERVVPTAEWSPPLARMGFMLLTVMMSRMRVLRVSQGTLFESKSVLKQLPSSFHQIDTSWTHVISQKNMCRRCRYVQNCIDYTYTGIQWYYTYPRKVTADRITFNSAISCCSQSWRRGLSVLTMMRAALVMPNEAWQSMMTHARTLCGCDCDDFLLTRKKNSKDSIRWTSLSMNVLAVSVCVCVKAPRNTVLHLPFSL